MINIKEWHNGYHLPGGIYDSGHPWYVTMELVRDHGDCNQGTAPVKVPEGRIRAWNDWTPDSDEALTKERALPEPYFDEVTIIPDDELRALILSMSEEI